MKKQLKRIVSIALAGMTLMSSLTCLPTVAAETKTTNSDGFFKIDKGNNATGAFLLNENDLTDDVEIIDNITNYRKNELAQTGSSAPTTIPAAVDNSESDYFPEIRSQGSIGSCTTWANVYYQFTYEMNRKIDRKTTTNNSFNPLWVYNCLNGGQNVGANVIDSFEFLQTQGAVELGTLNYDDTNIKTWNPQKKYWSDSLNYRIDSFKIFDEKYNSNVDLFREELAKGNLLTYTTFISSWNCKTIIKNDNAKENDNYIGETAVVYQDNTKKGCHRMTLVGYNDNIWVDINQNKTVDNGEMGAFKVANSWGTDFRNKGFAWVAYDALYSTSKVSNSNIENKTSIFYDIAKITVKEKDADADINLVYTLNSTKRNQTKIKISATKGSTTYVGEIAPYSVLASEKDEGSLSYDGTTNANDCTMVYALDNLTCDNQKISINSSNINDYVWEVFVDDYDQDNNNLSIKEIKIVDDNNLKEYPLSCEGSNTIDGISTLYTLNANKKGFRLYDAQNTFDKGAEVNARTKYFFSALGGTAPYTYTYKCENITDSKASEPKCDIYGGNLIVYYNEPDTYRITVTAKDADGHTVSKTYKTKATIEDLKADKMTSDMTRIKAYTSHNDYNVLAQTDINFSITTKNECIPYTSKDNKTHLNTLYFSIYKDGKKIDTLTPKLESRDIQTLNSKYKVTWKAPEAGNYKATFTIKDNSGHTTSTYCNFTATPRRIEITSVSSPTNVRAYKAITFTAKGKYDTLNNMSLTIKKDNATVYEAKSTRISYNENNFTSEHSVSWIPSVTGNYTAVWKATNSNNIPTTKQTTFTVESGTKLNIVCTSGNEAESANINLPKTYTFNITNGTAPYTYSYKCENTDNVQAEQPDIYLQKNGCKIYYRSTGSHTLSVTATDADNYTFTENFIIYVTDNPVKLTSLNTTANNYINKSITFTASTKYEALIAPKQNKVSLTIKKNGLTVATPKVDCTATHMDKLSSDLSASWTPTSTGQYTATWKITDAKGRTATQSVIFQVDIPINLTSGNLSNVNIDTRQTYTFSASSGNGPYTYKYSYVPAPNKTAPTIINSNNDSNCVIFFRSTGYNQIVVEVTDSKGNRSTKSFFINVVDNNVKISKANSPTGCTYQELTFDMSTQYESIKNPTYKNPVSLTIKKDGKTVATPTVEYVSKDLNQLIGKYRVKWSTNTAGKYTATWKVTDGKGRVATKTISFTVNMDIVPTCNMYTSTNINTLYGVSFGTCGGTGPITYSYTCKNISNSNATAPTIINNNSGCRIYFKSVGTYSFQVKAIDSKGNVGTKNYNIYVSDSPLKISSFSSTTAKVKKAVTFTATTQNETMYNTTDKNPVSLTITQNGKTVATPTVTRKSKNCRTLQGNYSASWTPTKKGTYCAVISITDYAGRTSSRTYHFTVS